MNVNAVSFSYADNSLQTRGLKLLQEKLDIQVYDMLNFNMPICNSNKSDGIVPEGVEQFIGTLEQADILIFAISEATSHYSAGFKNAMDWLVVKSKFNAKLGTDYAITDKPIFVVTFTPTKKNISNNGGRHFSMTKELLEKLGANVIHLEVVHDAWRTVVPNNYTPIENLVKEISHFSYGYNSKSKKIIVEDTGSPGWLELYNNWDKQWKSKQ